MKQHHRPNPAFPLRIPGKGACGGSDHAHQDRQDCAQTADTVGDCRHDGHPRQAPAAACCTAGTQVRNGISPAKQTPPPADATRVRYRIDKMDCPTEERLIRHRLEALPGIVRLDFNLLDRELTVHHRLDDPQPIVAGTDGRWIWPRACS